MDQWYNLTVTYELGTTNVYVNGNHITTLDGVTPIAENELSLMMGYDRPGVLEYYNGILDDIRIYDRILTEVEISMLFSADLGCITLGVDQIEDEKDFAVYPNPTSGLLFYKNLGSKHNFFEFYNLQGKLIFEGELENGIKSECIIIHVLNSY